VNEIAPGSFRRFIGILGQGLSLSFWRRPRSRIELAGFGIFLACSGLALLAFALQDYGSADPDSQFFGDGFHAHASYLLLVLAGAWLSTRILQRPALWLTLAALAIVIGIPWTAFSLYVNDWLADGEALQLYAWRILLALAGFTALFRAVGFLSSATPPLRRLAATTAFVLVLSAPWYWQQSAWFWYPPDANDEKPAPAADAATSEPKPSFDPALVGQRQAELLQRSVDAVRAQTAGKIDLFTIGFAGDGSEKVFRNEVEFFDRLMADRFDAAGRTLPLINSPETVDRVPLASLTNLRAALDDVAARMDTSEDVLVLFLTSHGSEDHSLYVGMDPLPLKQIRPVDLRAALDHSGIQWRVVVVSSCYSGGFVDALRDPRTLVITAARADRTSFGCGSDSQITWFGKAFLTQALNQTTDFEHAFDLADKQIREWELAQGETPSVPQISDGWQIRKHLAEWRATEPAPTRAVAFSPN
jgi:hypothetical protein